MKLVISRVVAFARCIVILFIAVLPFAPSAWAVWGVGPACYRSAPSSGAFAECLLRVATFAPHFVIFGFPIATNDEAPSPLPHVLLTAIVLAVPLTALSFTWRRLRASRRD